MQHSKDIEAKNNLARKVIALVKILYNDNIQEDRFSVNKFDALHNEHNFYIQNRIFEIQFKDNHWNILAESNASSGQYFKVGKIPSKFLTIRETEKLATYLTNIIEKKEIITSIEDLFD